MMAFKRIEHVEGMTALYADNNGKYDKVSDLKDCCIGDFVASLEMEFGEKTDEGVCLFGNPDMCFQTSGLMATGDGGANFGRYALFILDLLKTGLETLDTEEKKEIVGDMLDDYAKNGVTQGGEPIQLSDDQPADNTFCVKNMHKDTLVSEMTICGYEGACSLAKAELSKEFQKLIDKGVNTNIAHIKDEDGRLMGYRLNNVTMITIEKKAA